MNLKKLEYVIPSLTSFPQGNIYKTQAAIGYKKSD